MSIIDNIKNYWKKNVWGEYEYVEDKLKEENSLGTTNEVQAFVTGKTEILLEVYDGEKNAGDIGKIKNFRIDYVALRMRSWQMMLESEEYALIEKKYADRAIGNGLKIKSEPNTDVLNMYGINIDAQDFSAKVESIYDVYLKSKMASYNKEKTLGQLQHEAYINSNISGDILVVIRIEKDGVTVQHIDGIHLCEPDAGQLEAVESRGNEVILGIELTPQGQNYGFYVRTSDSKVEFIESYNGLFLQAFLLKSGISKVDSIRGIPRSASSMSSIAIMERYKNASLKKAEESAKVVYQIVHENNSDGSMAFKNNLQKQTGKWDTLTPQSDDGRNLMNNVKTTTGNQVVNNGIGQEIKPIATDNSQLFFKDFYTTMNNISIASRGLPPDVGMSMFNGSYSASRAAIVEMKFVCEQERESFDTNYITPILNAIIIHSIYDGILVADGYITSIKKGKWIIKESLLNHRVVGKDVEHIDPLKEVTAIRAALGKGYDEVSLITLEDGVERYNGSSFWDNVEQLSIENEAINKIKKIKSKEPKPSASN